MYFKLFECEITDIPIPDEWQPFTRPQLPEDHPWRHMPNWLRHRISFTDEVTINFYTQKADFELPFHTDDGIKCALNYVIRGDEPIVFEDCGPVDYKFALVNVSKRHMVPAGKIDRVLLRYSFMTLDIETVSQRLSPYLNGISTIKYNELNDVLKGEFGELSV